MMVFDAWTLDVEFPTFSVRIWRSYYGIPFLCHLCSLHCLTVSGSCRQVDNLCLFPGFCALNIFLFSYLRMFDIVACVTVMLKRFPGDSVNIRHIRQWFPRILRVVQCCSLTPTTRSVRHLRQQISWLCLSLHKTHWPWLCLCRTFTKILVLSSARHGFRIPGRIWNKMTEMTARENMDRFTMLNKRSRLFHSSLEKLPFCQYVCELILGVNISDLHFGTTIDSVKQPIKSNSVGPGNMSHCGTSTFDNHLDNGFVFLEDVQHGITLRRVCVTGHVIQLRQLINLRTIFLSHITGCFPCSVILLPLPEAAIFLPLPEAATEGFFLVWGGRNIWITMSKNLTQEDHPSFVQHPEKWSQILWSCEIPKFVSYTSNSQEQMFDLHINIRFLLKLISSLLGHQQSQSFGTIPIDNAVPYYPQDNIVGSLECDECKK